jgi:hypothetical protein
MLLHSVACADTEGDKIIKLVAAKNVENVLCFPLKMPLD